MSPQAGASPARAHRNLIDQLTADAIASDYAAADPAATPPEDSEAARRQRLRQQVLVAASGLALIGFVLALGLSARMVNEPAVIEQRKQLQERVRAADSRQQQLDTEVRELTAKLEAARAEALALTSLGAGVAAEIAQLELVTGYVAVRGPGVKVTMADAGEVKEGVDPELARVLDSDIQAAVNALWQSGAEAVAINGQRLTARSAIRSAAGAVLVNYRPLRPPYVISAIGEPGELLKRFKATPDVAALTDVARQFGIGFTTAESSELELPAAAGQLPDTAEVASEPSGGDGGSSGEETN